MTTVRWLLVLLIALVVLRCGGADLTLPNEGEPAALVMVAGNAQTGAVSQPAPEPLVVEVRDRFGNPVPGVEVTWSAGGGGSVDPERSTAGANGQATTQRLLGAQPGIYLTTAVLPAVPSASVTFTTTAVAARLVLVTQPSTAAVSGVPFERQPVLQLQDVDGQPLARPDVAVVAQIAVGGGTLGGTTTRLSDAQGRVGYTDLAIEGTPGARTLIFAAQDFASVTSDPIAIGIGDPASIAVAAGNNQSAQVGTAVPVPPAVIVRDAGGTPVPGVAVTFSVATGGGSVTGASQTTGVDGTATVGSWTLGQTLGTQTLRAQVPNAGVSGNPVTFSATAVAGGVSAERSSISASPTTITASEGSSFSTITVTARDNAGTPIAGLSVTLAVAGDGGGAGVTLTQPQSPTNSAGTTTGRLSATRAGSYRVSATIAGTLINGTATVAVAPGPVAAGNSSATVPDGEAGSPTVIDLVLRDQFQNPVPGAKARVHISVSGANAVSSLAVQDLGAGAYRASYVPKKSGTDLVSIQADGTALPGSPFSSTVVPGPADPEKTTATVPDGFLLSPVTIRVQVADAQGNPLGRGGDRVEISVREQATGPVIDHGDGTYSATWLPTSTGTFKVDIALNGVAIKGSPFDSHIRR